MARATLKVTPYGENGPGILAFGVPSFTRDGLTHECEINLATGECFCTCEWASIELNEKAKWNDGVRVVVREGPRIQDDELDTRPCKHARRVLQEAGWICAERERTAKRIDKELRRWAA